jgi:hypothetical protein
MPYEDHSMQNKRRRSKARLMAVPTSAPTVALHGATSNGNMAGQMAGRNAAVMSFNVLDDSANMSADQQMGADQTYERKLPKYPPADSLYDPSPLTRVVEAVIVWLTAAIAVALLLGPLTNP